jgi:AraC family transcriptional regulator of arabinose operon
MELLVYTNREVEGRPAAPVAHRLADQMKAHIQNHYRERVSKEELAQVIQRSPNHAAKIFRDTTGQTIGEYVHAVRMKTAVYMLQYSVLTVAEIAEFVGYSDPSYFYRVFRRVTGHVPAHFLAAREELRK